MKPTLKQVAIAFALYVLLGILLIGIAHARDKQWEPRQNDRVKAPEFGGDIVTGAAVLACILELARRR